MKKALLLMISVVWAFMVGAQGIARIGEELARPEPASGARIEVRMESDAAQAVQKADHSRINTSTIPAYRVRIFSDNSQNARGNAYRAQEQFAELYPGITVDVSYEVPYFWVTAGVFADHLEAVALRGRVLTHFKQAVVVRQEIPLEALIVSEKTDIETEIETGTENEPVEIQE